MYSFEQMLVSCALSVAATVAGLAAFRLSPVYPAIRELISKLIVGWKFGADEQARLRSSYERIVAARKSILDQATTDQLNKLYHQLDVWRDLRWLGVQTIKNPADAWMMQQIITEIRPDCIVETGTRRGGSALFFALILEGLQLDEAKVITIDVESLIEEVSRHPLFRKRVDFILGSSTDSAVVSAIAARVRGKKTVVFLDSDHRKAHVLRELEMYAPLVNPGSYLVVEDTNLDGVPISPEEGPGAFAAVEEFLATNRNFRRDLSREAFVLTWNPGGWLQRVD